MDKKAIAREQKGRYLAGTCNRTRARMKAKRSIHDETLTGLEDFVLNNGGLRFQAKRILAWIYQQGVIDPAGMTDLPAALRGSLGEEFYFSTMTLARKLVSRDGTVKLLLALHDGNRVESVMIPARGRVTGCVSTQAGCAYACRFCASGTSGFVRNLSAGEILEELIQVRQHAPGRLLTHVVFMGTGEPLDNYDNVMSAIRMINAPSGFGIGARRITISTCGIVPGIARLAGEGLQIELSVSLHAADDALRARLMPVNKKYPLKELIAACRSYARATKRQVTFEYILIKGVNASAEDARRLCSFIGDFESKVNLIPANPVEHLGIEPPNKLEILIFRDILVKGGIPATMRMPRGKDIDAACGQLRWRYEKT